MLEAASLEHRHHKPQQQQQQQEEEEVVAFSVAWERPPLNLHSSPRVAFSVA